MKIPEFSAEASLFNSAMRYQAAPDATFYDGLVTPAAFDTLDPGRQFPVLGLGPDTYHPRPAYCLKRNCRDIAPPGHPPRLLCWWGLGVWNFVTHACE
jgi:hypothetical protein